MATENKHLAGLDDVEWDELEHAYGTAEDVPDRLRALATGDEDARRDARYWLSGSIHHQGTIYSATAPAVPFLVRLACDPATNDRAWIVRFLADLAVSSPEDYVWSGAPRGRPEGDDDPLAMSYAAVEAALPQIVALLDDADPAVRANAAYTASFFFEHAAKVRDAVRARLASETDPAATASMLMALGVADNYLQDTSSQPLMAARLDAPAPLSTVAAVALCYGTEQGAGADPRALPVLARAFASPGAAWGPFPWFGRRTSPWGDGDVDALAIQHSFKLVPKDEYGKEDGPRAAELVELLFPVLERVGEGSSERERALAEHAMRPLFRMCTPCPAPEHGWTRETLRPRLRRFAEAIARRPFFVSGGLLDVFKENALPDDLEALQEWLGVRPTTPRDAMIAIGERTRSVRDWSGDLGDPAVSNAFVEAVAARPDAVAIAFAMAATAGGHQVGKIDDMSVELTPGPDAAAAMDPVPLRIVEAAAAAHPVRTYAAALDLARAHEAKGPPKSYGRWTTIHTNAMTLLCVAAAAACEPTGREPDPAFDAAIKHEITSAFHWPKVARYLGTLSAQRREAFLMSLVRGGVDFDENLDHVLALLSPSGRVETIERLARSGDFRKAADKLRTWPSTSVLEIVVERIDGTLDQMKNWAKDDIPKQAEGDAQLLAALGLWTYGVLSRAAASPALAFPETFARALAIIDERSSVSSAMRDARAKRDDRGLVPIDDARRWLSGRDRFCKGDGEMLEGTFVLESDRTWAALLSLEDATEFVKHATRLAWEFHVRGRDNLALHERYGDAILPWLRSRLKGKVLYNVPWCVLPCLLAIGNRDALALALDARAVHELLPGQPGAGGGPGAFAHDEVDRGNAPVPEVAPEDARTWLGKSEELDVARSWIARHPTMYGTLATMADGGDVRAEALLRDRAQALGDVVREAVEDALGVAEASRIAARFALPASTLPAEAKAVLDDAETVDEPRGPLWSIAELDEAAQSYDLPLWDNAHYTTGAMRITGFASRHGDTLVVEWISTSPRHDEMVGWAAHAYGPGATNRDASEDLVDAKAEELERIELGGDDYVDGVGLHMTLYGERDAKGESVVGANGWRKVPVPLPMEEQILKVKRALLGMKGDEARADWHLPRSFATPSEEAQAGLRAVTPREAMLVQLCAKHADQMFAFDNYFAAKFGFDGDAKKVFQLTRFAWPAAGELASSSIDVVTMVAALRARKKITRLPGVASSTPEHWIPRCAELRSYEGGDAWPEGESPIAVERPTDGPGASPYWSWLIESRGYPHGAMVMHAAAWNQKGMAEQTVPYLVNATAPAMQVFWPRRTAILWARVVGSAKAKWSADDPKIARAMKDDRMLYAAEARELVASFVGRDLGAPRHVGADFVDVLEALVGGREIVEMFAEAIDDLEGAAWTTDHAALAGAVFELGFVLRRLDAGREDARAKLATLWSDAIRERTNDVARALDLVLHGRAGAERSARTELDYAHVPANERAWARERIVDAAPSRASALLVAVAGDALVDKYMARIATEADPLFVAVQLAKVRGPRAVKALLELYAREPLRGSIEQAFTQTRPDAKEELALALRGPFADAARAMLAAVERVEAQKLDEKYGDHDE